MGKYQIVDRKNSPGLKEHLVKEGQVLLPFVESIERAEKALDEVTDEAGRATIEAVLELSARRVAGDKHPGRVGSEVRWHGHQRGVVGLSERQLRVRKLRIPLNAITCSAASRSRIPGKPIAHRSVDVS